MHEIWYGIGMELEVLKIVFHSILEIFHSILASSTFHRPINISAPFHFPFRTMPYRYLMVCILLLNDRMSLSLGHMNNYFFLLVFEFAKIVISLFTPASVVNQNRDNNVTFIYRYRPVS